MFLYYYRLWNVGGTIVKVQIYTRYYIVYKTLAKLNEDMGLIITGKHLNMRLHRNIYSMYAGLICVRMAYIRFTLIFLRNYLISSKCILKNVSQNMIWRGVWCEINFWDVQWNFLNLDPQHFYRKYFLNLDPQKLRPVEGFVTGQNIGSETTYLTLGFSKF